MLRQAERSFEDWRNWVSFDSRDDSSKGNMILTTSSSFRNDHSSGGGELSTFQRDSFNVNNFNRVGPEQNLEPMSSYHEDSSINSSLNMDRLSSAIGELLSDRGSENYDYNDDWQKLPVEFWTKTDARNWLIDASHRLDAYYQQIQGSFRKLRRNTSDLSIADFIRYDAKNGKKIYDLLYKHDPGNGDPLRALERLCAPCDQKEVTSPGSCSENSESETRVSGKSGQNSGNRRSDNRGSDSKHKCIPQSQDIWKYIIRWLHSPKYNPVFICWENYEEGKFRFVQPKEIAKLWGARKRRIGQNIMTYENFTRTMRYHYHTSGRLAPVYGKKHVYKFGNSAIGWRTDNPILSKSYHRSDYEEHESTHNLHCEEK